MPNHQKNRWLEQTNVSNHPYVLFQLLKVFIIERQIRGLPLALVNTNDPYFPFAFRRQECQGCPIANAINIHLSCERRGGRNVANPYSNPLNAFHITFYEMIPAVNATHDVEIDITNADERERRSQRATEALLRVSERQGLKIGHLYEKPHPEAGHEGVSSPISRAFRLSAFTVCPLALIFPIYIGPKAKGAWALTPL